MYINKGVVPILILVIFIVAACSNSSEHTPSNVQLQLKVDSLEMEMAELKVLLRPGLGELMNTNNMFFQKLATDIETENWEYAQFHLHEMEEIFERIEELHNHHDELVQPADVQLAAFIFPAFEKLEKAVEEKSIAEAKAGYINLEAGCNKCHQANNMSFIVIN